ncbi:MAG: PqqD family protein [Clostridia bacterium]|nr:PqqD family protein [Clostridia bacterium]
MKIKEGFLLREIAGSWVVVPVGNRVVEFNGLLTLSESGALLWRLMEKGTEKDALVGLLLKEYDIDSTTAEADVEEFISLVSEKGLFER